jgi:glutamate dehydrogenase
VDIEQEPFTVVGIGDMGGDVFGNGMLLSRHIQLVGAFNHQHIFLDPNPDPEASFGERRRLFDGPACSWADYEQAAISPGGGVWPRSAKSIPISVEARWVLGIEDKSLLPSDLIRALLKAPVDLLWNGGIGTFVKSAGESHAEAGDRTNDTIRIDGRDLRCKVVGEGGNLGLTQRARIEYALVRWPHQHRLHRQLRGGELLRSRGQHQDPLERRDGGGGSHPQAAGPLDRGDDR